MHTSSGGTRKEILPLSFTSWRLMTADGRVLGPFEEVDVDQRVAGAGMNVCAGANLRASG
jgi:hypothetical protein